jgi:hypothetical protein
MATSSKSSRVFARLVRASVIGFVAVAAYFLTRSRATIPAHMSGHKVLSFPGLISEENGNMLNALMRELGSFDSNVNADLKSGFSGAREDIGEGRPVSPDGTCSHQYLIPNVNKTLCALPQRIDVGRHFMLTGGPDAVREPYEKLIDRLSSFGKYMTDMAKYPRVADLFSTDGFQSAAKQICPADRQFLDPFQFNFIIQVPGQTVALHIDAPYFWGANRMDVPQWLLAVMVYSNLFKERFIDQVQVVGYLHRWSPEDKENVGGDFVYYPGGDLPAQTLAPVPLAGNSVDGSKTVHAALVYKPGESAPHIDKSSDATLKYAGNEKWALEVDGKVSRVYDTDDLRISIVYRARCFKDAEEVARYKKNPDSEKLSVETVLETLKNDLVAKNIISRDRLNLMSTLKLALFLMDHYITYPMPSLAQTWMPYNYCALPKLFPATKSLMNLFC